MENMHLKEETLLKKHLIREFELINKTLPNESKKILL